jgi:hypothetical protein
MGLLTLGAKNLEIHREMAGLILLLSSQKREDFPFAIVPYQLELMNKQTPYQLTACRYCNCTAGGDPVPGR